MSNYKWIALLIGLLLVNSQVIYSQKKNTMKNRQAFAAGRFYTSNPIELENELADLFAKAKQKQYDNVRAIICPHAGYVYSGEVAASSFNQMDEHKEYENVFVIASSHTASYNGASIYNIGNYETPLGEVTVNLELATQLVKEHKVFTFYPAAHKQEHSLEVQLPFLQYKLKKDFRIVPIVIGTHALDDCKAIANALMPYFNEKNLFVFSTDFSHYPTYDEAKRIDKKTAMAVASKSVNQLHETLEQNKEEGVEGLATSMCGYSSVYTLLYLTENNESYKIHPLQYLNSGDQVFGDKYRVVGYYSLIVTREDSDFTLSDAEKQLLLAYARSTIATYLTEGEHEKLLPENLTKSTKTKCGAFVSLKIDGALRGCIGRFSENQELHQVIRDMAIASATQDSRFPRLSVEELDEVEIEISVLTPMKEIDSIDEIELGRHGIYVRKDMRSGTFLPQVATETGWSKEEFLGHCARDKARIGWYGWKDAEVYTYEALVFSEKDFND